MLGEWEALVAVLLMITSVSWATLLFFPALAAVTRTSCLLPGPRLQHLTLVHWVLLPRSQKKATSISPTCLGLTSAAPSQLLIQPVLTARLWHLLSHPILDSRCTCVWGGLCAENPHKHLSMREGLSHFLTTLDSMGGIALCFEAQRLWTVSAWCPAQQPGRSGSALWRLRKQPVKPPGQQARPRCRRLQGALAAVIASHPVCPEARDGVRGPVTSSKV